MYSSLDIRHLLIAALSRSCYTAYEKSFADNGTAKNCSPHLGFAAAYHKLPELAKRLIVSPRRSKLAYLSHLSFVAFPDEDLVSRCLHKSTSEVLLLLLLDP